MGEVFLAYDTKLDRHVALKILSRRFAADPTRVRRFTNEAKAIASLNHPNIAHVYDLGGSEGTYFIAMEYVDGQSLATRLAVGPCAVDEILAIGTQIADALAEAHAQGVVHRDIKPANVMLTDRGLVKVLDFGLAKVLPGEEERSAEETTTLDVTTPGMILGTPRYMSPEQALGRPADRRSDVFSLGAVLYEMAAARRPYPGQTPAALFGALLHNPPPPSSFRSEIPAELDRIVAKALDREPGLRYQTASDLAADLRRLKRDLESCQPTAPCPAAEPARPARSIWWSVAAALVVSIAILGVTWWQLSRSAAPAPLEVVPLTALPGVERQPSFSPDGNQIAFSWNNEAENNWDIYVKLIDSASTLRLTTNPATDSSPAWSPDGRQIVFLRTAVDAAAFYLISPLGGEERKLIDVHSNRGLLDAPYAAWSPDGRVLAIMDREDAVGPMSLYLFDPATGGKRRLTTPPPKTTGDASPCFSPDGKQVLFVRTISLAVQDLYTVPVAGGEPRRLTSENRRIYGSVWNRADGKIVFTSARDGTAHLWRLNPSNGRMQQIQGAGEFASFLAISPKGDHLAYARSSIDTNVWRYSLLSPAEPPRRLISSTRYEQRPLYSPRGDRIAFASNRSGSWEIWAADNEGQNAIRLTNQGGPATGSPAWSPDGKLIAFDSRPNGNPDVYVIGTEGGTPRRMTTEPTQEIVPSWSRDGKWIYFASDRSGAYQLWKMPAEGGAAVQVTRNGGFHGIESPEGDYLYYARSSEGSGLWRIPLQGGPEQEVLASLRGGYWGYWGIDTKGIYFVDREEIDKSIVYFLRFLRLADRKITTVTQLNKRPFNSGISLSPDGHWFLYTQVDQSDTDIMFVPNFR